MVLIRSLTLLSLVALLAEPRLVHAQTLSPRKIEKDGCRLLVVNQKKNKLVGTKTSFPAGTTVKTRKLSEGVFAGQKVSNKSNFYLFEHPKSAQILYVGNGTCLFSPPSTTFSSSSKYKEEPNVPLYKDSSSWVKRSSFFAQTYRSELNIVFPDKKTGILDTQNILIMPEFAMVYKTLYSEWALSVGLFYGRVEVGQSLSEILDPALKDYTYKAKNISIYGAELAPAYYFRPSSKHVAFGIKFPLKWSQANWPLPGPQYSVSPSNEFSISYLLETRVERDNFFVVQNFGFFKKIGRVLWSLGLGYQF